MGHSCGCISGCRQCSTRMLSSSLSACGLVILSSQVTTDWMHDASQVAHASMFRHRGYVPARPVGLVDVTAAPPSSSSLPYCMRLARPPICPSVTASPLADFCLLSACCPSPNSNPLLVPGWSLPGPLLTAPLPGPLPKPLPGLLPAQAPTLPPRLPPLPPLPPVQPHHLWSYR